MKTFSLESFKDAINVDKALKDKIVGDIDTFDEENGIAVVHQGNLSKYLEKFMCKDQDELSDYLYYYKGIFLKVI